MRLSLAALVVLLAASLPGCPSPRTEVIVVVDSDMPLTSVAIGVTAPDGTTQSSTANLGAGDPPLPRTLGLVHTTGPLGPFVVRAGGLVGTTTRVIREAEFTFVRGETRVLRIDLLSSCATVSCSAGMTCAAGGCRARVVTTTELEPWTGTVTGLDAGPRDASAIDAPSVDAPGTDAPRLDAPTPIDAPMPIDAPTPIDAPMPIDAPAMTDAPMPVDAPPGTDAPGALRTCDAIYGGLGAYQLCTETATDCTFYVDGPGMGTCDAFCGGLGGTCSAAFNEGGADVCAVGGPLMCSGSHNDQVCTCSRIP